MQYGLLLHPQLIEDFANPGHLITFALYLDKRATKNKPLTAAPRIKWANATNPRITCFINAGDIVVWRRLRQIGHRMPKSKSQVQKFREAARDLETDENEKRFNEKLGKIAKQKPAPKSIKKYKR